MSNIKRNLAEVGDVTPEFSPNLKQLRIGDIAHFLRGRFRLRDGVFTEKSRVLDVVMKEYDSAANAGVVGRATSKAFGSRLYVKRSSSKFATTYANLEEYHTSNTPDNPEEYHTSNTPETTLPSPTLTPSKIPLPSPRKTIADPTLLPDAQAEGSLPPRDQERTSRIPIRSQSVTYRLPQTHIPPLSAAERTLLEMMRNARTPYTKPILVSEEEAKFVDRMRFRRDPYNVAQLVSTAEAVILKAMRENKTDLLNMMMKLNVYNRLEQAIVEYCTSLIKREVVFYAQSSLCLLKKSSAKDMETFSLKRLWEEFQVDIPILTEIIVGVCSRDDTKQKIKTRESIIPAVTAVIAKCVGIYSRRLSSMRTFYSIVLSQGGVTAVTMNRLARLYDCTTYQSVLPKLNLIAEGYLVDLNEWIVRRKEFAVVFDNVDMYVKPRMESKSKSNTMSHMVQAIAVQERVEAKDKGEPHTYIDDIKASELVPTAREMEKLRRLMVDEVLRVWSAIPGLKDVKLELRDETHEYSTFMKKKSQLVNLGVKKKNENIKEELLVCLQEYHDLVPEKDDSLEHKLCIGDYLSFERGQMVVSSQSDGKTAADRLEGLVMGIADFHVQMNFLKMGYKVLFKGDSQPSVGSLAHAKDFLNAKNVVADPCKNYYGCGALFDKVHKSYLNNVALKELGMTTLESDTSPDPPSVRQAAEQAVAKFVDLTFPDLNETGKIRCSKCTRKYSSHKNLQKHHIKDHPDEPIDGEEKDSVFSYSCALITIGLIRAIHNRAIQLGNGEIIMLLYKFMYLIFKANGSFKYGCGLLETVIQTYVLPKDISTRLIWNRFFNAYHKPDSNIPLDLQLEHENRMFKELLKTYRGQFTQAHLDRISKGRHRIEKMIQALDKELGYHGSQAGKRQSLAEADIRALSELYAKHNLLNEEGVRAHSPTLTNITRNLTGGMNGKSMREWLTERIELCKIRNYYRQFSRGRYQPSSDDFTSSLEPMPESDESIVY